MKKVQFFLISVLLITMVLVLSAANPVTKITVWTIGDSTMAAKSASSAPESGWGEALQGYLKANATVKNRAANGRSTLSFINEGRWKAVIDSLKKGDYLIIQFGHNDQKENPKLHTDPFGSFQDNIRKFITEAKKKGATPIVCTSIVRRHFDGNRNLKDTHGDYIKGTWEVAMATYTPCVDLEASTRELVDRKSVV